MVRRLPVFPLGYSKKSLLFNMEWILSNVKHSEGIIVSLSMELSSVKWNVDASVNLLSSSSAIRGILASVIMLETFYICFPHLFMEINCVEILVIHPAIKISLSNDVTKQCTITLESNSSNVLWRNSDKGGLGS